MTIYSLFVIAIALSLDAFGVALSIGLNEKIRAKNKIIFCLSFAFFQFLFAFIGAYFGKLFSTYIASLPGVVGGIIISVLGVIMIKEGMGEKKQDLLLRKSMYLVLGVSVSIDAMVIGFTTLNSIVQLTKITEHTLFIGVITLIMSGIAFSISKYIKKIAIVSKYSDYIGGTILILFGLKMMFI